MKRRKVLFTSRRTFSQGLVWIYAPEKGEEISVEEETGNMRSEGNICVFSLRERVEDGTRKDN